MIKKGDIHYEYLVEFQPRYHVGIVDRFLRIPENYLKPGGKVAKLGRFGEMRDVIVRLLMKVWIITVIMMTMMVIIIMMMMMMMIMMTFSQPILAK